jgi:hypothetical protein
MRRAIRVGLVLVAAGCSSPAINTGASSTGNGGGTSGGGTSSGQATSSALASSTGGSGTGTGVGSSSSGGTSLCSGSPLFCDDFTNAALAADYTTFNGTWVRAVGSLTVTDSTAYERARATLTGVTALATGVSDFDVTFAGHTEGDYGFGLIWAGSAMNNDGYAVIVHPGTYQGIYLKQLIPGQNDVNITSYALPAGLAGTPMTVRVLRQGSQVTVWFNGAQVLSASDGAGPVTGLLGLCLSDTAITGGGGAVFDLFRVDAAGPYPAGGGSSGGSSGATSGSTSSSSSGGSTGGTTGSSGGSSSSGSSGGSSGAAPVPDGPGGTWTIAFDDEFNGTALDASNWNSGWLSCPASPGVGDITAVTDSQQSGTYFGPAAFSFPGDGALHIRLQGPVDPGAPSGFNTLESGLITTAGLWNLNPGSASYSGPGQNINGTQVIEIRARLAGPASDGADYWPAFWMSNAGNYGCGGQSYSEEVDFLEGLGNGSNGSNLQFHLHAASSYGGVSIVPQSDQGLDYSLAYHVWTFELSPTQIQEWCDSTLVTSVAPTSGQVSVQWATPQYLMLAFQANAGADFPTSATGSPNDLMIDYVRIWTSG